MTGINLKQYYMDLHIHIGRTNRGRPVKITASKNLTLMSILEESLNRKGLNIIGVIDAHSPEVLKEIEDLVDKGYALELPGGGVSYKNRLTLLLGTELEIYDENCFGPIHTLCFFPTIDAMRRFSAWCENYIKNIHLSSQRVYVMGKQLQEQVRLLDGWFIPAHIFTPFKSLYGKGVERSLEEVFDPKGITAVELGLSSDTQMADQLTELREFPFLTNSDAHSTLKIAREHQILELQSPSFHEVELALKNIKGRKIHRNVGLDPRLGKYYLSICRVCETTAVNGECPNGHNKGIIKGVSERINELSTIQFNSGPCKVDRPDYLHQVPLEFIPGCGPKTMTKLLTAFGSEMKILHETNGQMLLEVVPVKIAEKIMEARTGKIAIQEGGAGKYGRIK